MRQWTRDANLAQAIVTVVIAAAFGAATYLTGEADSRWESSVRDNVRSSAGLLEDVRYLFIDEAPVAFEYSVAQARADALTEAADTAPKGEAGVALIEADLVRTSADLQQQDRAMSGDSLLEQEYWRGDHFDIPARLADLRARNGAESEQASRESGDRFAVAALGVSALPIPVAMVYLIFWGRRRTVQGQSGSSGSSAELDQIPPVPAGPGLVTVAFASWLLLTVVPPLQIYQQLNDDRASSESANAAVQVLRDVVAGNVVDSFEVTVRNRVVSLNGMAERRALTYQYLPSAERQGQATVLEADEALAGEYARLADATLVSDEEWPDLDEATLTSLTADPADWEEAVNRQRELSLRADTASRREDALSLSLLLAAVATTLAALAKVERRSFSIPIMGGVVAIAAGVTAIFGMVL